MRLWVPKESLPNSSCRFWNHKVRVYSNFASQSSVLDKISPSKLNCQTFEWLGENSQKFLMSYLNPQVSVSLNFESVFSVMRDNSSVLFLADIVHDLDKRNPSPCKISRNLYFDRLLLLIVHKISAKKVQRSYVSLQWRVMQNLKNNWFVVSKMTRVRWISTRALKTRVRLNGLWFDVV